MDEKGLPPPWTFSRGSRSSCPPKSTFRGRPGVLPTGALVLDGDKTAQFAFYKDPDEIDRIQWRGGKSFFSPWFAGLGEKSAWITRPDVFSTFKRSLRDQPGRR
jgi:hypothetical protein